MGDSSGIVGMDDSYFVGLGDVVGVGIWEHWFSSYWYGRYISVVA